MTGLQFDITTGANGFDIIGAGQSANGNYFWIVLTGITDGANVTLKVKKEEPFTLAKLGSHIPDGYPLYNKFTSISIDVLQTTGAAICYRANQNFSID